MAKECQYCGKTEHIRYKGPTCGHCYYIYIKRATLSDPERRFKLAQRNAKRRGHSWEIDFQFFCEMLEKQCFYCEENLTFCTGSGLDRINNKLGYLYNNVLPCCSSCNYIRGEQLTVTEAKIAIMAVVAHRKLVTIK
jgi:hypothetical protein